MRITNSNDPQSAGAARSVQPTNPYHISRAYGVKAPAAAAKAPEAEARTTAPGAARLVAAVVPGGVDFSADEPRPSGPALPMYRHPADKNAAATAVNVGRRLDVQG